MSYKLNNKSIKALGFKLISNNFPQLQRLKNEVSVPGRDGNVYIDLKTYAPRVVTCEHLSVNFRETTYETLYNFFSEFEGELVFDFDTNRKWIVQHITLEDIEDEFGFVHKFKVNYHCHPFRKRTEEKTATITTNTATLTNEGFNECRPNIIITPKPYKTDIWFSVNGEEFRILNVDGAKGDIKVLGDSLTVVQGKRALETQGTFPLLVKGSNTVTGSESYQTLKLEANENFA